MKGIAIILMGCMLLLNTGDLLALIQSQGDVTEISCCTDCSADCCEKEDKQHEDKDACDSDQECLPGCDCPAHFQITALAYSFVEVTGVPVHSFHYVGYMNTYTFEYSEYFLHPPRFA